MLCVTDRSEAGQLHTRAGIVQRRSYSLTTKDFYYRLRHVCESRDRYGMEPEWQLDCYRVWINKILEWSLVLSSGCCARSGRRSGASGRPALSWTHL